MPICLRRVAPATLLFSLLATSAALAQSSAPTPYNSVDPLIGTAGGGNTFPEASVHIGSIFGDSTLIITSEGSGPWVTAISLNGQPYNSLWLPLDKIAPHATTTLHFTLQSAEPTSTQLQSPPAFRP